VLRQILKRQALVPGSRRSHESAKQQAPSRPSADPEEQRHLFEVARTKAPWLYAYVAATLAFYCGLRACEIKGTTLAGYRSFQPTASCPTIKNTRRLALLNAERHLSPSASRASDDRDEARTRPAGAFRVPVACAQQTSRPDQTDDILAHCAASVRKAPRFLHVRFHDGRHTAITTLAEKGLPDWVIQAQLGHVAPEMMKTYSHIRRQALNQAADALEPSGTAPPAPPTPRAPAMKPSARSQRVMSHGASQNARRRGRVLKFVL